MALTPASMTTWLRTILAADEQPKLELQDYLRSIPTLKDLGDVPSGTSVLVRGDLDCKPGENVGDGDIRLESMRATLQHGQGRGWKQIIFGHIGRDPKLGLESVAKRLGQILKCDVPLICNWLDNSTNKISPEAVQKIKDSSPGSVLMLDNIRKYDIERMLWKAKADSIPDLAGPLAAVANEFADKLASVYVNEAFSAGSLDTSTTVIPAAMARVALGDYVSEQFNGPMLECLKAQLVIFSGLKADKLDDMEAVIQRGHVKQLFCAGSLAMALIKANAQLNGADFSIGVAEDPAHSDKPYFIPPDRVEQAKRMLVEGRKNNIEFILPIDFTLADGSSSDGIGPGHQQFDIGPKSIDYFAKKVDEVIAKAKVAATTDKPLVVFHNGVFGKFEEPKFEKGTREFTKQLKRMTDAGAKTFVGGGEGGAALEKYGDLNWVTHCFTAGGTVLNALGSQPVPYLVALRMAAQRTGR